ncbi:MULTISPECIES: hypothetical protein [Thalassobaculum]|uniref:Uncharacterized protein n=1 Tax=Thalassobaculum litoreum DSM 18839 TaxID=1123362 RepID=A0A8G2EZ30_9PROT|nr:MULTISPECIES: hypothetical protein [Thalassobaculum]SDG05536.1 hypothetical protein SAMN05660686_03238 [Thalassobaculum litoreum DSM 18839]
MKDNDRKAPETDMLGRPVGDPATSYICTQTVDKLAWRSRITAEQSMAILRAAGMAGRPHDDN